MRTFAFGCAVLLVACGGSAPVRTQYLLRAERLPQAARAAGPARIGLGQVAVAPYLDQPGIVVETGAREGRPAQNHRWAEPLSDGRRLYLWSALASALGEDVGLNPADRNRWDYVVDVFVERFHGTASGEAVLVAVFRVEPRAAAEQGTEHPFTGSLALAREGYDALVDAEVALAGQLADAIAKAVPRRR
jgi:uncharacterized lipoprotein YmbA